VGANVSNGKYTVEKVKDLEIKEPTEAVSRDIRMPKSSLGIYNELLEQQTFPKDDATWTNLVNTQAHKYAIQTRRQQRQDKLAQEIKSQNPR
jgi:hypothetical protein